MGACTPASSRRPRPGEGSDTVERIDLPPVALGDMLHEDAAHQGARAVGAGLPQQVRCQQDGLQRACLCRQESHGHKKKNVTCARHQRHRHLATPAERKQRSVHPIPVQPHNMMVLEDLSVVVSYSAPKTPKAEAIHLYYI